MDVEQVKLLHLNHTRKLKALGAPSKDFKFLNNNKTITVQQYYEGRVFLLLVINVHTPFHINVIRHYIRFQQYDNLRPTFNLFISETYGSKLPNGKLQYPFLPTINCGTATHPVLVPPEVVMVHPCI